MYYFYISSLLGRTTTAPLLPEARSAPALSHPSGFPMPLSELVAVDACVGMGRLSDEGHNVTQSPCFPPVSVRFSLIGIRW
ncbi:hypothetical protein ACFXTO_024436 [Malus domestica]